MANGQAYLWSPACMYIITNGGFIIFTLNVGVRIESKSKLCYDPGWSLVPELEVGGCEGSSQGAWVAMSVKGWSTLGTTVTRDQMLHDWATYMLALGA